MIDQAGTKELTIKISRKILRKSSRHSKFNLYFREVNSTLLAPLEICKNRTARRGTMIPRKWSGEINLQFAASTRRECCVKNGGPQTCNASKGRRGERSRANKNEVKREREYETCSRGDRNHILNFHKRVRRASLFLSFLSSTSTFLPRLSPFIRSSHG